MQGINYRIIIDKLTSSGEYERGVVLSIARVDKDTVRVHVKNKRKKRVYDVQVSDCTTGKAAAIDAVHQIKDKL